MKESKVFKLKNGLTLLFYKDSTKHSMVANIIVKYGGINNEFIVDNQKHRTKDGIAHFLEHLLIEHSIYGNALTHFNTKYINTNGITNSRMTNFYIDTVSDFEDSLIELINIVNIPHFTKEDVATTKYAIIEEIRKNNDNKFRNLNKKTLSCLFKNIKYQNNLGTASTIKSLTYEEVKQCYDLFYQPSNQVIAICGNINIPKLKKLITKAYENLNKEKIVYQIPDFNEPNEIVSKEGYVTEDINEEYVQISYKINISALTNYEQVKLTFYLNYFLENNFDESSDAYRKLIYQKISVHNITYSYYVIDKFIIVEIGTYTNKKEKFVNLINSTIKNKKFNEEFFQIRKNRTIIALLLREENPLDMLLPLVDNVIMYNYYENDKISDIENYTFEDYQYLINKLDFTNYCITEIRKKEVKAPKEGIKASSK